MEDVKALPILIYSKLNRPKVVENHIHRPHLIAKLDHRLNRPVRRYLIYLGEEYRTIDNVQLLPVAALFRAK